MLLSLFQGLPGACLAVRGEHRQPDHHLQQQLRGHGEQGRTVVHLAHKTITLNLNLNKMFLFVLRKL